MAYELKNLNITPIESWVYKANICNKAIAYELKELKLTHRNSWVYETNICDDASQCITKRIGTRPADLYARLATLGKAGWQVHGVLEAGSSKQESHRLYLLQRQS